VSMPALVADVHPVDAPRGHPTTAQLEAVQDAERRARQLLPRSVSPTWTWFHAPSSRTAGLTRFSAYGPRVYINDHLAPTECYRVALHELQHVADADLIPTITRAESERRAEMFVERALRGDVHTMTTTPTNGDHATRQALGREGHAICDRADREHRRLTPAEARRFNNILDQLDDLPELETLRAGPVRTCICGGAVLSSSPIPTCFGCGRIFFS
jgi:hypothetical protein